MNEFNTKIEYPNFGFEVTHRDPASHARIGKLQTPHGTVETPNFIFVGTKAAVRNLHPHQLREAGADVMRHDTNMLFVRVGEEHATALGEYMKAQGVLINASPIVRLVMHLDVSREQLAEVVAHWRAFLTR